MTALSTIDWATGQTNKLPDGLQPYRLRNQADLATVEIPTRKTESWKYSAKRLKLAERYAAPSTKAAQYQSSYELDCYTLHLVNGQYQPTNETIPGLSVKTFAELSTREIDLIQAGVIAQSHSLQFATLNAAYLQEGLYLELAAQVTLDKPLKIVLQHSGAGLSQPRVFVHVGRSATLCLIEEVQFDAPPESAALLNGVCDILVEENAQLRYLRMNLDQGAGKHICATGVRLMRHARFNSYCMALGSELARHDLLVELAEPGAECALNGVCVTREQQHYDNHTCIEHIAPNCSSTENYRCIADQQSQIVFNGRIHIHPKAQKSSALMSNRNLLLSSEAEIDTKPELEIYADDVKCAHGSTIGQLNADEVYYLQTRGIPKEQARLMLTLGFMLELVRAVPIEPVAMFWEAELSKVLRYEP